MSSSLVSILKSSIRSFGSRFCIFLKYVLQILILYFDEDNSNEVALNVGLFIFYPTILWILLNKSYGFCDPNNFDNAEEYQHKIELLDVNKGMSTYFCLLMRTYKFGLIMVFHKQAASKNSSSQRNINIVNATTTTSSSGGGGGGGQQATSTATATNTPVVRATLAATTATTTTPSVPLITRIRNLFICRAWMHLVHEFTLVAFVCLLICICTPALACWVQFFTIICSTIRLIQFTKRLWKEAQIQYREDNEVETATEEEMEELVLLPANLVLPNDNNNSDDNK